MTVGLLIRSLIPCVCRFQLCSRLVASRTEPSLLQPLNIDEVRLKFSTTEGEQIWFISGTCTISPGVTPVTLFCPVSLSSFPFDAPDGPSPVFLPQTAMSGRLALELSQIRFSRIIFQYSHRPVSNRNLAPDPRNLPLGGQQPIIHFPRDPQALNVYTELPRASQPNLYLPRLDYPNSDLFCSRFAQSTSINTDESSSASRRAEINSSRSRSRSRFPTPTCLSPSPLQ